MPAFKALAEFDDVEDDEVVEWGDSIVLRGSDAERIGQLDEGSPWNWDKDEAQEVLFRVLANKSEDAELRLKAVRLAGDAIVSSDSTMTKLLAVLDDDAESDELRGAAASSLGVSLEMWDIDREDGDISDFAAKACQATLKRLIRDESVPKLVRRRALEATVRAPKDWHLAALRTAWETGDAEWRRTAVFCARFVRGFDAEVIESLDFEDFWTRVHALQSAGAQELRTPKTRALVRKILEDGLPRNASDEDKALLVAAIEAAPGVLPRKDARRVLDEYARHEDEDVAYSAEDAAIMNGLSRELF